MSRFRTKVGIAIGTVAVLSMLSSTKEQRRATQERLRPYNWVFGLIALILWGLILFR